MTLSLSDIPTNVGLKYEILRLGTFQAWTPYDRASPILLAKAGFYYTGNEDVVQCFSCHITKGDWKRSQNTLSIHRELNPDCTFCQERENVNIPILVPDQLECDQIQDTLHRQYCEDDTHVVSSTGLSRQVLDNSDYSSASYRQNQTQTNFPVVATDAGRAETSRQAIGVRGTLGRGHDSEAASTREQFSPMKQESNRFSSFESTWPSQDTPDPRKLARTGFYYTGTVDRVQCAFCRGILRNWNEDDVPMQEHRRHFPMCPFVMGLDVGNIPDHTALIAANRTSEFMSSTQPSAVVSDASLGIVTERPKHAQYAVEAARITSFRNWPSGKEQTPQSLAEAGFLYPGFGDSVKCFFWGGGLRTWERGDDPWVEHVIWFPHCPYIKQVKGEEFIKSATEAQEIEVKCKDAFDKAQSWVLNGQQNLYSRLESTAPPESNPELNLTAGETGKNSDTEYEGSRSYEGKHGASNARGKFDASQVTSVSDFSNEALPKEPESNVHD